MDESLFRINSIRHVFGVTHLTCWKRFLLSCFCKLSAR